VPRKNANKNAANLDLLLVSIQKDERIIALNNPTISYHTVALARADGRTRMESNHDRSEHVTRLGPAEFHGAGNRTPDARFFLSKESGEPSGPSECYHGTARPRPQLRRSRGEVFGAIHV